MARLGTYSCTVAVSACRCHGRPAASDAAHVPAEVFGIAWWIPGACLVRSLLTLVLRRTLFPDDNQPRARRLYADLV
jgi:hypothetical protein